MAEFYTILTAIGKAKLANSTALGTKLNLTKFQVGDGAGAYYNPTESQTTLKNKLWEGSIGSISVDNENPNWIILETIIPSQDGGFTIREAGIFDDENNLIAIGKYPETYKPVLSEGSAKDLIIKMILEVSNTSSVTLKVDPTVILATKKDVETLENRIKNISIPVTSVNGKAGNIVLSTNDIKTTDGRTVEKALEEKADSFTKSDLTDLDSSNTIASSKAVKTTMDKAIKAYDLADGKQDKVVIAEKTPTDLPSTYPLGYSTFYTSSSAWKTSCGGSSISSAYAVVETCHAKMNYGITQKITWFNSSHNVLSKMERASYSQSAWGAWSNIPTGIDISGVTKIEVVNGILRIHY